MSEKQKRVLIVALVLHVIMLKLTWLDLSRRPDAGVRGPKRIWRLWSGLNTAGSVAYWMFGRRPVSQLGVVETEDRPR
jgi:hypothetical protein